MDSEHTTLRVKKTTRDLMNKLANERKVSVEDLLNVLAKSKEDATKQVMFTVDNEKYYTMLEIARVLHRVKLIEAPRVEDAALLAMDNLIKGMEKSLEEANASRSLQSTAVQGQW